MVRDPFVDMVEQKRKEALERMRAIRISALIWGPAPSSRTPVAQAREELRRALESDGHLVHYSEELYDATLPHSLLAQQIADVEAHDITFSLPDSAGSIAEIHDFWRIPSVATKIVAFVSEDDNTGYSNSTLIQAESIATARMQLYKT
ncbi:MAG TPA: hypothetical protein VFD36_24285, partial [Kofleriaceae bacterium]|nr:hypothetical protein [Kofleriaceae bacterium]